MLGLKCIDFISYSVIDMKKVLIVIGTRPEAIKMAPLIVKLKSDNHHFDTRVCLTAQHREMLDQVLNFFNIEPDYDLDLMRPNQSLYTLSAGVLTGLQSCLEAFKPHYVLVHGDTTTSTFAAVAAFYAGAKVLHIEAGLRTFNKYAPYPEEMNRSITARLADIHFAPTVRAKENLLKENIAKESIVITGNTVIDALYLGLNLINEHSEEISSLKKQINFEKKIILVTGHRRENFGEGVLNICEALKFLAQKYSDTVEIVYPVHLNPNIQGPVTHQLAAISNVKLIPPLDYEAFIWLMNKSFFILTDSGGIQEEAPSLGKPVLVMRDITERPEAVEAGTVILVGTNKECIVSNSERLLEDSDHYKNMAGKHNPYGDGKASNRIIEWLINYEV